MLTISYVARPVRHRRPRVTIGRPRSLPGIQGASRRLASFGIIAITTWMCELCPNTIKRTITYMVHGNEIALTRTYRDAVKHLSCCTFFCIYPCVSLLPAAPCESVFASARACVPSRAAIRAPRCSAAQSAPAEFSARTESCLRAVPACSRGSRRRRNLTPAYSLRRKRGLRNMVASMFGGFAVFLCMATLVARTY